MPTDPDCSTGKKSEVKMRFLHNYKKIKKGLAQNFYGESFEKLGDKVDKIFDIYDVDDSGELSYQEARCFLKGIQEFLEDDPDISEEQKEKIAKEMVEACKLFWDVNTFFF